MPIFERDPLYNTKTFNQIYKNAETMLSDYLASPFGSLNYVTNATVNLTFALLTAKHGNSPIKNLSEEQFKMKLFSLIMSYGPTFQKKLDLQKQLRDLTADEMLEGNKQISDAVDNPEYANFAGQELDGITRQNVSRLKKSKIQGISDLWNMLSPDLTGEYIAQFNQLFSVFLHNETTYVEEVEE